VEVPWSGDEGCGKRIMELTEADALGTPMDSDEKPSDLRDLACGDRKAEVWLRLSRRY
jgi:prolyl-tRNA synthetase